jgi:regulatory protein
MEAVETAVELALGYLDRRMRSRRELERYLGRKSIDDETRRHALERLDELGVLDDFAYARAFARDRARMRPKGYRLVSRELAERGVERSVVDTALREVEDEYPEPALAASLLVKRRRQYAGLDRADAEVKARRWLTSRGFRHESIRHAVETAAWLDDGHEEDDDTA